MRFAAHFLAVVIGLGAAMPALAWYEPARGTQERKDLMNTVRPLAEGELGAPVEFVVRDLRVNGNVAFASLQPQRPGGGQIPWRETAMAARGEDPMMFDGSAIHVLYLRTSRGWLVDDWSIGATDVWWANAEACSVYRTVTPEACAYVD